MSRSLAQGRIGTSVDVELLLDPFRLVPLHLERTLNETQLTTALTIHDTQLELRPGQNASVSSEDGADPPLLDRR